MKSSEPLRNMAGAVFCAQIWALNDSVTVRAIIEGPMSLARDFEDEDMVVGAQVA